MRWSTVADTLAEVEAVGETRGDSRALVDNLADTLEEVETASTNASVSETVRPLRANLPVRRLVSRSPPLLVCQPEC